MDVGSLGYDLVKTLHVVAVVAWMAGLLYLPRLMVYHADSAVGSQQSETFKVMERRLLRAIMGPAMILVWTLGLTLAWSGGWFSAGWLQAKLALVIGLSAVHDFLARRVRDFAADRNGRSARFYRLLNEVPTLLMIGIVAFVVLKRF